MAADPTNVGHYWVALLHSEEISDGSLAQFFIYAEDTFM